MQDTSHMGSNTKKTKKFDTGNTKRFKRTATRCRSISSSLWGTFWFYTVQGPNYRMFSFRFTNSLWSLSLTERQRWSGGHKARGQGHKKIQGQGQPFRGQTLSRPRTGMLEAKDVKMRPGGRSLGLGRPRGLHLC